MQNIEIVSFGQIQHLLPDDCWAKSRNNLKREYDNEKVIYIQGDARVSALDLDNLSSITAGKLSDDTWIFLIFLEGNLTVDSWIGNNDTDGAPGIIVKGHLRTKNAILGGQQVYVCGDMVVDEFFWGEYNHGDLIVVGDTSAALFVATEQYHFDLRGKKSFRHELIGDGSGESGWKFIDFATMSKLIVPVCLSDDPDIENILSRQQVLDQFRSGKSVLRIAGPVQQPVEVAPLFNDRNVTIENILKVADPRRMSADLEGRGAPRLEFWTGDTVCRATAMGPEDELNAQRIIYLQDDNHALVFTIILEENPRSFWQKLFRKPSTGTWRMSFKGRRFHDDVDGDWEVFEPEPVFEATRAFPERYYSLLATGWNALLDGISNYDQASILIAPDEVRRLLALPVVEPYDNFYGDTAGFCVGQVHCAFRQEGASYEHKPQPAMLRVDREYVHPDGRDLIESYFFAIYLQFDGKERVFISYKHDQDSEDGRLPLSFLGGHHLDLAVMAFNVARRRLDEANRQLLEHSIPPDWYDGFAIRHWKEKGVIKKLSKNWKN